MLLVAQELYPSHGALLRVLATFMGPKATAGRRDLPPELFPPPLTLRVQVPIWYIFGWALKRIHRKPFKAQVCTIYIYI